MNRTTSLALAVFLTAPMGLPAQTPDTTSMRYALERLREAGNGGVAGLLLHQERGNLSAQERDALADSLVTIVIASQRGEGEQRRMGRMALSAVSTLASAGDASRPTPYARAFDALVRIFHGMSHEPHKATVLSSMQYLADRGRVIEFMAEAASDPGAVVSVTAVRQLANYLGEEGQARLRRLYEEDAVVNRTARGHLGSIAAHLGWGSEGSGG